MTWQPYSTRPRDATVLLTVEATEANTTFSGYPRHTLPAYIDDHGRACDCGTWKPDAGLDGTHWRATDWRALPEPASVDTRPQGGDANAAPFTSGAVPEGQTANTFQGPNP